MRRWLLICSTALLVLCAASGIFAADRVTVVCGDFPVRFESEPFIDGGVTFVPLRDICAALGARLAWYERTQDIVVEYGGQTIHMKIGSDVLKNVDGKQVLQAAPRLINNRTYVSLSAFSQGFQKKLKWDETTATARLVLEQRTVVVSTVEELINAIQPDTQIVMKPGVYDLSQADWTKTVNPLYVYQFDVNGGGSQLAAYGVRNLSIVGNGSQMITQWGYADVLRFVDCRMISLQGLRLGHVDAEESCTGNVLDFRQCEDVRIEDCHLSGSAAYGLMAAETKGLRVVNSTIEKCGKGMINLTDSSSFLFDGLSLNNCQGVSMIDLKKCSSVLFDRCTFENNRGKALFGGMDSSLLFRECSFSDNGFTDGKKTVNGDVSATYENTLPTAAEE